jgi:predicted nucleic acid-binding protein
MYLLDTNIFLEILLQQAKKDVCKSFLDAHVGDLALSDFSLHSIGVILFRHANADVFKQFALDTLPKIELVSITNAAYEGFSDEAAQFHLDFDDAYQFLLARDYGFTLVTMDSDFTRVQQEIPILFL